jgi:Tol biopolymer transport system component
VVFTSLVDGTRQIFSRLPATGGPVQVTKDDFDHFFPRWADDDKLIYFRQGSEGNSGGLWEVPWVGGACHLADETARERVRRLDITVKNAGIVRCSQAVGDAHEQLDSLSPRVPFAIQPNRESSPVY